MYKEYYYLEGDKQKGPLNIEQLKSVGLKPDTFVWTEGLDDWKPAKQFKELNFLLKQPVINRSISKSKTVKIVLCAFTVVVASVLAGVHIERIISKKEQRTEIDLTMYANEYIDENVNMGSVSQTKTGVDVPETSTQQKQDIRSNEIPPDGKYLFDLKSAELTDEVSKSEKVSVIIKGNTIRVIYEGDGTGMITAEKGTVFEDGIIMKHKSGVWIIGTNQSDVQLDEICSCCDGPNIIDFKNKIYWTC